MLQRISSWITIAAACGSGAVELAADLAPIAPEGSEIGWQAVGQRQLGGCPAQVGWTVTELSDEFCLYRFTGATFDETDYDDLEADLLNLTNILDLQKDRLIVTSLSSALHAAVAPALARQFLNQVGSVDLPMVNNSPHVRLVLLDTSPSLASGFENSDHGKTLRTMAKSLLCSGQGCVAEFGSRLALAYEQSSYGSRNDAHGGFVGTLGDLALAISEVTDNAPPNEKWVLNLSIGWEPEYATYTFRDDKSPLALAVRAVRDEIEDAACNGHLVIAASGNKAGSSTLSTGPMFPAAWEGELTQACGSPPVQRPLIYAVGGVDASGLPLVNARPASSPRLAAYGDHAAAVGPDGTLSAILTGSSVAALVASAAAAGVWHYNPTLSAETVVDTLYASGSDLGQIADFGLGANNQQVHSISICKAVRAACPAFPGGCTAPATAATENLICPAVSTSGIELSGEDFSLFESLASTHFLSVGELDPPPASCAPDRIVVDENQPSNQEFCPHRMHHGVKSRPWLTPQPQTHVCPGCIFNEVSGTLQAQISLPTLATQTGVTLSNPTLTLCPNSATPVSVSLSVAQPLQHGDAFVAVVGPNLSPCGQATLAVTVNGSSTGASTSPLLVVP